MKKIIFCVLLSTPFLSQAEYIPSGDKSLNFLCATTDQSAKPVNLMALNLLIDNESTPENLKLAYNIAMVQFADRAAVSDTSNNPQAYAVQGCEAAAVEVGSDTISFTCSNDVGSGTLSFDAAAQTLTASVNFPKGVPYLDFPIEAGATIELSCFSTAQ